MSNIKFALRGLMKTPFVTSVAIISLALGIGANTAIFSLFNQLLIRPLPVQEPARLVNLESPGPKPGSMSSNMAGRSNAIFSYPMFRDLERVQTVFTGVAAHRLFGANLAYAGITSNGEGVLVSGGYFPVLGLKAAVGRLIDARDDRAVGQSPVVVLTYDFWRTQCGANAAIVGQPMVVNGQTLTIVGVAPRGFMGTTAGPIPRIFVPITMRAVLRDGTPGAFEARRDYWAYLFARLKPGVSIDQARAALNLQYTRIVNDVEAPLQKGMSDQTMRQFRARQLVVTPGARGQSTVEIAARPALTMLLAVTGLVLLIACANIANLLLARGTSRSSEMAVRLAIGAGRRHVVLQLLTESVLLAIVGGAAGLLVARWTLQLMASLMPVYVAAFVDLTLDPIVVLFTAALAILTGLLFGLFPALHTTRPDLASTLKGQAGQPGGSRSAKWFRTALATAQIALSMALLVAAGLFTRSLWNISRVDVGINPERMVTFAVSPRLNGYANEKSAALFERLEDELAAIPGVTGVTAAEVPLLAGSNWQNDVSVEGFTSGPDTDVNSHVNGIAPGHFKTLDVRLLAGREFTRADAASQPKVAIVNEQFTKKFNLGRNAVGRRMSRDRDARELDLEIVGVVQNIKYADVKAEIPAQCFIPYRQDKEVGNLTFYVRTSLDAEALLAWIPKAVARLDPNLPVEDLRTMPQQVRDNFFLDRFISVLSAAFASLATLLAAIGLYGVLAYTVAQRTRELGLRMALGAEPGRVRAMVLRQVGWMTVIGGAVGLAAALGIGRAARALLFEMEGQDPSILVGAAALLTLVALGAGFIPAYRASRIDPLKALRYE